VPSSHPGYLRKVYPGFLQHAGFVAMNPDRHLTSHWDYYLDLVKGDLDDVEGHRRFYDEYNAVLDLPAEYYLETIRIVFQEHRLPKGTWDVRGKRVRRRTSARWRCSPSKANSTTSRAAARPGRARPVHRHPEDKQQHLTAEGAGHYGIFSGRRWREMIYPRVRDFIRANN
jgi:poly(3-hydroxybutyrate) depolymerase